MRKIDGTKRVENLNAPNSKFQSRLYEMEPRNMRRMPQAVNDDIGRSYRVASSYYIFKDTF